MNVEKLYEEYEKASEIFLAVDWRDEEAWHRAYSEVVYRETMWRRAREIEEMEKDYGRS